MSRKRDALSCRAKNWSDDETRTLFNIYGDYVERRKFEGLENHTRIYISISKDMEDVGFSDRQWRECKNKILNLKATYNKELKKIKSGSSQSGWALFNDIHEIMARKHHSNDNLVGVHDSLEPVDVHAHLEDEMDAFASEKHHCDDSSTNSFASGNSEPGVGTCLPEEKPNPLCSNPKIQEAVKVKRTRCRPVEESPTTTKLYEKIVELMEKRHKLDVAAQARENALAKSMKTFFDVQTELMRAQLRQLNASPTSYVITPQPSSSNLHAQQSSPSVRDKSQQVNFIGSTVTPSVDRPASQTLHATRLSESDVLSIAQQINMIRPTTMLPSISLGNPQPNPLPGFSKKINFSKIRILNVKAPLPDKTPE